jgi:hypothetical protein
MPLEYVLKDIPYYRILAVNYLLGTLNSLDDTALNEFAYHKRLVELSCHVLRDAALMKMKLGSDDDDRTG